MNRFMGGLHQCMCARCNARIPRRQILCEHHFEMLPRWLVQRMREARAYGEAWKCHPTDEFLKLRGQAIAIADAEDAKRRGPPQGEQLPLIPVS